jgi:hypothetical protein
MDLSLFLRIIEMIIGNAFVTVVSIRLFRIIQSKVKHIDIALFGFLWIYITSLYTLLIGVFGLLQSHKIAIISLLGLIIFAIFSLKKIKSFFSQPRFCLLSNLHIPKISFIGVLLCIFAFLQFIRIIIHIWLVPPYVWDTVVYHLVNVAEWVQKERIYPLVTPVGRVYWPASFELLEAWWTVFLHHELLLKVAPFLYYLVTGASAYAIARSLNLNRIMSAYAMIFYLFTPSLAIQATACKNDVGISAIYLFSIAILIDLLVNGKRDSFPLHRQLLFVIMALCLGIGIKPYTAFIAIAPFIIFVFALWKQRKSIFHNPLNPPLLRGNSPNSPLERGSGVCKYVCIFLLISAIFLGSFWYVRNWVVFGNPVHPTDVRIGSHLIFGTGDAVQFGPGQRGSASLIGLRDNLKALVVERIFDKSGAYSSHLSNMTGWGWFNFACGLPALIYALIFVRHLRLLIISFILSLISLFTFISIDPWYMRFTLWFPVIFALSFAFLLSNISYKWLRGLLFAVALICTLLNWIAVLNVGEISVDDFQKMMSMPALQRSTAELTAHYEGAFRKALQIIPKDEIIGVCFPNNGWAYPLYDADYSRRLEYMPIENIGFTQEMKQKGINYLFIERIADAQTKLIQKAVQDGSLKKIEGFLYALK